MTVRCHACGQEWPEHPARAVACTRCGAAPGSPCRRPSEHELYGGGVHREREEKALAEGFLEMCPEGPTARGEGRARTEDGLAQELPALF